MPKLVVRLLGGFRVELDGKAVYGFDSDKCRALLAYLVVEAGRPHRREILASLLWPDRPDAVARKSLRQALFRLRQTLSDYEPPFFVLSTSTDVQFNTASEYALDVADLEAFAAPGRPLQLLPEALCGDFLAGLAAPESEAFQAWLLNKQEHYHLLALETLGRQNAGFEMLGDFEQAVAAARLQLRLEPWLEEAHRRCMRGLALAGRRDEALHQYELCCRALKAELDVEPTESTQALRADIQAGRPLLRPAAKPAGPGAAFEPAGSQAEPKPVGRGTLPRYVAREDQLGRLTQHLHAALAGETGVAFVSGDPGTGKTTLLEAFVASSMDEHADLLVAAARCSPGGSLDPFAPLQRLAESLFGDLGNPTAWRLHGSEQANRLHAATRAALACLSDHGPDLAGTLVPVASIARRAGLSFVGAGSFARDPLRGRAPLPSQTDLFDQLTATLAALGQHQPLLLLLDDLHWVDDATAAFLLHLGRELSDSRLLILGAYRSGTVALGRRDPQSGELTRHPLAAVVNELRQCKGDIVIELDRADGRAFVEAYVDIEPNCLGAPFRDALFAQTGGHALFTVELLRNLQARGEIFRDEAGRWVAREALDWGGLPARVEAAIAERLERLPEAERRLLSAASVQGDDFSAEMVAELVGVPQLEVLASLSNSLSRQHHLVRPQGVQRPGQEEPQGRAGSIYRFTHHLFQKYLYDALDPVERAQMLAAVADSLDRQTGDGGAQRERMGAELARHYEAGQLPLQAARALLDAGRDAMRLYAHREALARYDYGLAPLACAPRSAERDEVGRLLEVARLVPQRNIDGMGTSGVQRGLAQARAAFASSAGEPARAELSAGNAEGRAQRLMLLAEAEGLMGAGKLDLSLAAAERLRAEAEQSGEEDLLASALYILGMDLHHLGRLMESDARLKAAVHLGQQERLAGASRVTGYSVVPPALGYSAVNLWFLGYGDTAVARSAGAIGRAVKAGDRFGHVVAAVTGGVLHFLLRDEDRFAACCEQGHSVSVECGFGWWRAYLDVLLGRLPIRGAPGAAGIERMRRGIAEWHDLGMAVASDLLMLVYADGCLAAAKTCPEDSGAQRGELIATGLATLDTALGPAKLAHGLLYEAELHRLRGELLLARDGLAAAEEARACFDRAMALGRAQGALAWELRGAMSILRLRTRTRTEKPGEARTGELAEASERVREVYDGFTQGFASPDLQDAAALLGAGEETPRTA